ncbi:MAG: polysaccharide biosynthesis tyrosine autokinase [Xenococcaceae cyanobacterium MO_188.B32]|nr:polysaccharide biosynthesis tyrosine autokinase [Xenococcaceae cyanobacterium MO_188.B32]
MSDMLKNDWETEFSYTQLLNIVLKRRIWFLTVFLSVLFMTALATLVSKETYQSKMQLLVEPNYSNKELLNEGNNVNNSSTSAQNIDYATQLNLMRSSQFIAKALELLKPEYPDTEIKHIDSNLNLIQLVEDKTNTKIFQAEYIDEDPVKTQKVLLALQQVYQDYNLEREKSRLREGLAFLDNQLPSAQENLDKAQSSLENFRSEQHLINPEQKAEAIAANLDEIRSQKLNVEADYQETKIRYQTLQNQLYLPLDKALAYSRLGESKSYQSLLADLQATDVALAEKRLVFTDASYQVRDLLEKRQSLLNLLRQKARQILGSSLARKMSKEDFTAQAELGAKEKGVMAQLLESHNQLLSLEARRNALAKAEQNLQKELDRFSSLIAKYDNLKPEVAIQRETIKQLLEKRQELSLELARGGFKWQVVEAPELGKKIAPNPKKNMFLGGVLGIFLGGIAVFIREVTDDSIKTTADLINSVAFPLLGVTPELPSARVKDSPDKLFLNHSELDSSESSLLKANNFTNHLALKPSLNQVVRWRPYREAVDLIYQKIKLAFSTPVKSILVTSCYGGDDKSTVALCLALSAARLHQKVVVLDINLRCSTLHKQLNLDNEYGLSTILSNPETSVRLKRSTLSNAHIDILTAGPECTDPVSLLSSQRMKQLIDWLEENYDLVLLDASGLLAGKLATDAFTKTYSQSADFISASVGVVDVLETGSLCNGVVMVTQLNETSKSELKEAEQILSKLNVIGMIVNGGITLDENFDLDFDFDKK